jgi:hypothetical protein
LPDLTPFLVVTTTFDTRGLFRNVLVSVFTPLASTVVEISELSGAGRVVAVGSVALFAVALALAVALSFVFEQPTATAASNSIVTMQSFLVTPLSSSVLRKLLELFGNRRARFAHDGEDSFL